MTEESPDKFTAADPLTQNTIKVDNHGHDFHAYIYEYGASSPVVMNQETVRAIMSEGARRERERIALEESCPDCGVTFDHCILTEEGWHNRPPPDDVIERFFIKGKKPDDPNHPRGKPHKWEPGFLERIASLPKPPNDGSD